MPKPSRLAPRRHEIRELYRSGLSTTEIARLLGEPSYGAVQWMVRDIARDRNDAIALSKPPTSMKYGACHARARSLVKRKLGIRSTRQHLIHHKDHDYTNNALDNLQLMSAGEHMRIHDVLNARWRKHRAKTQSS